jgi:hypothetical protein
MSDAPQQVLTREEIDAILASVASASSDDPRSRRLAGSTESQTFAWTPVARALRDFGDESGRRLSSVYERTIAISLLDLRSLPADDRGRDAADRRAGLAELRARRRRRAADRTHALLRLVDARPRRRDRREPAVCP